MIENALIITLMYLTSLLANIIIGLIPTQLLLLLLLLGNYNNLIGIKMIISL